MTPSTFLVVNTNDSGPGSFRLAILDANGNPGADLIQFNIPGSGVQTISPLSGLPTITETVTLDGRSEGVFQGIPDYSGPPLIRLDGTNTPEDTSGLIITGSNCSVSGLVINNFFLRGESNAAGIWITGVGATGNKILGNYIGISADGGTSQPNEFGVLIDAGASGNTIGGTDPGSRNVISGNNQQGIIIKGAGTTNNLVEGNFIGPTPDGTHTFAGSISIGSGATGNTIGGIVSGARNVISGGGGVSLGDGTLVEGNYIGTNAAGTAALPNGTGIFITGAGNMIGGTVPGAGNVISGNRDVGGMLIEGNAATGNVIQGNLIGTDATGTMALGNSTGIIVQANASNNLIGGTTPQARNIISGNTLGLQIFAANSFEGNFIGTDITGTKAVPNGTGIQLSISNCTLGGTQAGAGNLISGNSGAGVACDGATGDRIEGNLIGTDVTGKAPLPNDDGVVFGENNSGNIVGGTASGAGNIIAFNKGDPIFGGNGVIFFDTPNNSDNSILSNSIFSNAQLGIWLSNQLNFQYPPPLLSPLTTVGEVTGNLDAFNRAPNTTFRLEFFANETCDPSGNGEGKDFLGFLMVTTDAHGKAAFTFHYTPISGEPIITATATDANGTTSGFSNCVDRTDTDLVGRVSQSGQIWTSLTTGSSFTTSLWTVWSTGTTWVDVLTGDFNGDGLIDIAARDANTGKWWVGLSNGSAFTMSVWTMWSTGVTWADVQVGDFNGDGKADIIGRYAEGGQWWIAFSTGLSNFANALWDTWSTGVTWVDVKVGDFNGDGQTDITGRALQNGRWYTGLSNGSAFTTSLWATWSTGATWVDVQVGDFDGDGKADITGRYQQGGTWWTALSNASSFVTSPAPWAAWSTGATWVDVRVGDFNGDGKADIIGRALENGQWYVGLSNGSTGFTTSLWAAWSTGVSWVDVQVGDFTGDGKSDITGRALQTGDWWTGLSNGSGFDTSKWATWSTGVTWTAVRTGDFA